MKNISGFCVIVFIFLFGKIHSQTLIASDDFENSLTFFTGTPEFYSGNSAVGDRPANSPFAVTNTYSCGVTNGALVLVSNPVDISAYTSSFLKLRVAAFSINNVASGLDNIDFVRIDISPDGGFNYFPTIRVTGNTNAYWSFAGGTGNASTPYDGNVGGPTFMPAAGGGERTADGYSTITVTNLPQVSNLRVRISILNNFAAERWVIDNFEIRGTPVVGPLINIYPFSLGGFSGITGSPSAEQTFEVRGSSLTNNITINAPAGFQVSTTTGSGFASSLTLTQSGGTVPNTTIYVRMNSTTLGSNAGNISNTSTGATTKNIPVSGSVIAPEPTVASTVTISNITGTSMDVNFSGGNGAERIVVVREDSAVTGLPVDGTDYNANSVFRAGSSLGGFQYVVYKGSGTSVNVTGLNPNLSYHVAVFEYNDGGVVAARNYFNTAGVANATTSIVTEGLEITATNTLFRIDFDNTVARVNNGAFTGISINATPVAGELNSNAWSIGSSSSGSSIFGGSNNTGGGVSPGNVTTGTFYSFETVPGNRVLGLQPTETFMSPGVITLRLQNTTGGIINTLVLSYKSYVYNNENNRTGSWLTYSKDNWDYDNTANIDTSIALADASPLWKVKLRSTRLTGLAVPHGSIIYLRWNFDDGEILPGNRDEVALDDIQIVAEPINVFPKASGNYDAMQVACPIQLEGNTTVATGVGLSGEIVELGDYDITIDGSVASTGSGYFRTNGTGTVTINNVTTSKLFPVGNSTYNPVTIDNGSGLNWTVRVDDGVTNSQPPFTTDNAVLRTWTITPSVNPPPAGANVTFGYNDGDVLQIGPNFINTEDVQVWHFDGTDWTPVSAAITPGGTAGGMRTVTLSNWTVFSPFAIANFVSTLPVEFGLIKAIQTSGGIKVTWENLTESEIESYSIERSHDGRQYTTLGQVGPQRNDAGKASYDWFDMSPNNGINFYRIRAAEIGGKVIYSKVVFLDIIRQHPNFLVLPNPVNNHLAYLNLSNIAKDNYSISVFSMNGQELYQKSIVHQGGSVILPFQLPSAIQPGIYMVKLSGRELRLISKVVIR